jgi:hypothetical protein
MPRPPKPLLERRKRPSDLVRLIEGQARALGALQASQADLRQTEELLSKHEAERRRLAQAIASLSALTAKTARRIRELYPEVNPDLIEPVAPLPKAYSGHGSLIASIRAAVNRPDGCWVSTNEIVDHVVATHGLQFATAAERKAWRKTAVRNKLARLCEAGELERRPEGRTILYRVSQCPTVIDPAR